MLINDLFQNWDTNNDLNFPGFGVYSVIYDSANFRSLDQLAYGGPAAHVYIWGMKLHSSTCLLGRLVELEAEKLRVLGLNPVIDISSFLSYIKSN